MSQGKLSLGLITGIIIAVFFGVALYLRIALPYDYVFSGDWIKFTTNDAYYYMHLIDNLGHNFPHLISFDPYMRYPQGLELGSANLFVYLIGGFTWLVGLGSPTQHTIDIVSAYFPAIVGALTIIPVYFIGKMLFNRWAGVIAAGLFAIYPGESLARTVLGSMDRDAVEILFIALTVLFFILAVKTARQRQLAFHHLMRRDWAPITKPLIYGLLAGIFLGAFLLIWRGALLLVFIISVYFIIQFIIDHLRHKSTDYQCFVGTVTFFVALIICGLASSIQLYVASLVIALLIPLVLAGISWLMMEKRVKPLYYPLTIIGLGIVALAIFYVISPSLLSAMLGNFGRIFAQSSYELTTLESVPILFPEGNLSFSIVWNNFTTSFFLSFVSLGILIYFTVKRGEADKTLFIVWSLVILAFTLAMRRFALLLAVNVALLVGYLSWLILEFTGFKETTVLPAVTLVKARRKATWGKRDKSGFPLNISRLRMTLGVIVVFFLVFFPNFGRAAETARHPLYAPDDAWIESLSWLKDNTADPFGDPDFYYRLYETPFHYPETAYGVVAWWDYGYWIIRIGHRLPNCDPGGGDRRRVSQFFTAQEEASANRIIEQLGSKYVIIDYETTTGKFYGVATYAGRGGEEFYEVCYRVIMGKYVPVVVFYPEFYRSLAIRLYNFGGSEVVPQHSTVISYKEKVRQGGEPYKEITSLQDFSSYEEAQDYVSRQESGNYRIVGTDPLVSPVHLEALEHYRPVYSSAPEFLSTYYLKGELSGSMNSKVKIFEYAR